MLKTLGLGLLALVGVATIASAEPLTPVQYYKLRQQADQRFAEGEADKAAALYGRLAEANPADGDLRLLLALALFETGDPGALTLAAEALAQGFGNEPGAAYEIARELAAIGETDGALGWLQRALAAGYEDQATIKAEPAFETLMDDPRFRDIAGLLPADATTRETGWTSDLDLFLDEARRLHAAPDRAAHSAEIEQAVETLKGRINELTDEQIAVALQAIMVGLGDGHSSLIPIPTEKVAFETLPVAFYWFDDAIIVTAAGDPSLVGKRVTAVGGRPLDQLHEDLRDYVSRDNDFGLAAVGVLLMRYPSILQAMGYADAGAPVLLTLTDELGAEQVELVPAQFDAPRGLSALPGAETVPLWLRAPGDNYWHEPLPDLDALYVQFNRVRDKADQSIADYAAELKDVLRDQGFSSLILDVRHNGGGNNFLVRPLVRLAVWHEEQARDHQLFVITGQRTFSAAQNFINRLEQMTDAVFVGEPSSSRPNFTGETTSVELPYSGIRISISSNYWQDSQPGDRRPFIPMALPAAISSKDYLAGRDPAMAALRELLAE